MMNYTIPQHINSDKIFIVHRSELEGRIDTFYYKKEFENVYNKINSSKFQVVDFKFVIKSIQNGYDFRDYKANGTPYLKVANIKKGEFDFSNIQYIDFNSSEIKKNIQLKKGNLLLTRKGTFGNALSINNELDYVISSEVFYIELIQQLINSKYLAIYLNLFLGQAQFQKISIGAIMGSLSQESLKKLRIPLPPLPTQQQIVTLYQNAYQQKQQKETQAKALLDSIDDYLLEELGITLPEQDHSLQSRVFTTQFSEITGGRVDPNYKNLKVLLDKAFFPSVRISDVAKINPGWTKKVNEQEVSFIPMEFIDEKIGEISKVEVGISSQSKGYTLFEENDILWAKITPCMQNGKSAIAKNLRNKKGFGSTEFFVVRCSDKIDNRFLHAILRLKVLRIAAMSFFGGATGHQRVPASFFREYRIPLPPLEKQNEIAEKIASIRNQAKHLQQEATQILKEAQTQVEQMIIG